MQHLIRSLCFTGHRPSKLCSPYRETSPVVRQITAFLEDEIAAAIAHGCTAFYTGMAMGVDLMAAEAVLRAQVQYPFIHLYAIIPYAGQSDRYPPVWKARYQQVLQAADLVHYLQSDYSPGCMRRRNRYLVEHSDLVVAVFNGNSRSGTAQTIRMAREQKKELHLLQHTEDGWETLQNVAPDAG